MFPLVSLINELTKFWWNGQIKILDFSCSQVIQNYLDLSPNVCKMCDFVYNLCTYVQSVKVCYCIASYLVHWTTLHSVADLFTSLEIVQPCCNYLHKDYSLTTVSWDIRSGNKEEFNPGSISIERPAFYQLSYHAPLSVIVSICLYNQHPTWGSNLFIYGHSQTPYRWPTDFCCASL